MKGKKDENKEKCKTEQKIKESKRDEDRWFHLSWFSRGYTK
jgi:hypothetical protein